MIHGVEQEIAQTTKNLDALSKQRNDVFKKLGKTAIRPEDEVERERLKKEFESLSNRITRTRNYRYHLLELGGLLEEQASFDRQAKAAANSVQKEVVEEQRKKLQMRIEQHQSSRPPSL